MKDTQETSVLRKFVKIQPSFAVAIQWSLQVDLASHVSGDTHAFCVQCVVHCVHGCKSSNANSYLHAAASVISLT